MTVVEEMFSVARLPDIFLKPIPVPISPQELSELQTMRIAAGLYYDRIPRWIQEVQQGTRQMFFVYLSNPLAHAIRQQHPLQPALGLPSITYPVSTLEESSHTVPLPFAHAFQGIQSPSIRSQSAPAAVGMVCFLLNNAEDPSLASFSTTGRVELTSLFVYAAYRPLGVALAVLRAMEQRAAQMGALYVTITAPAVERSLQKYFDTGYREYKPRAIAYSQAEVQSAGLGPEYATGAFLEKRIA